MSCNLVWFFMCLFVSLMFVVVNVVGVVFKMIVVMVVRDIVCVCVIKFSICVIVSLYVMCV